MTDTERQELREKIARIIDPSPWRVMDSYKEQMLRKYHGEEIGYDPEQFQHKETLVKADAILSLLDERDALSEQVEKQQRVGNLIVSRRDLADLMDAKDAAESRAEALTRENEGLREAVAKAIRVLGNAWTHELTRVVDARDILVLASQPPADEPAKGDSK